MAICDNMKTIRQKKGMTQKQVAEACGLADSTIRTYELGNANPKPATVAKIAKALGVSAAELYGVDWIPGIGTSDQETNSALYQSLLADEGALPIDNPSKKRLLVAFDRLNADGQMEAIKRTEELAQIPAYQTFPANLTSDEIDTIRFACHTILNQQYELELMEQLGEKCGPGVDASYRLIKDRLGKITDIILKHFPDIGPQRRTSTGDRINEGSPGTIKVSAKLPGQG